MAKDKDTKKQGGGKKGAHSAATTAEALKPSGPPRLKTLFDEQVRKAVAEKFGITNPMEMPRLQKITLNVNMGRHLEGTKIPPNVRTTVLDTIQKVSGQKPIVQKAKKSVANFKVREGQETGLKVTLRGPRMYEFLDRLISLAFPRVKDFRGVNPNGFDRDGNFNFGFTEQTVFPEVDGAAVTFQQGMNITMVTSAQSPDEGRELLKQFGFPFRGENEGK